MSDISLWIVPGDGLRTVEVDSNTTVQDLVQSFSLSDRDIAIDGKPVKRDDWASTKVHGADEVWATKAQKGA